jgi:probable HAF family extracellular repeat protein
MKTLALMLVLTLGAGAQTFTTFAVNPNKAGTDAVAINDSGEVTGIYGCDPNYSGYQQCGFTRDPAGGIKHLGLGNCPTAINNSGEFVGYWCNNQAYDKYAFYSLPDGKLVRFLGNSKPRPRPYPAGVNNAGWIAGIYCTSSYDCAKYIFSVFLRDASGVVTDIFSPPRGVSGVSGPNKLNQVVGSWASNRSTNGFVYSNGTVNDSFNYPGAAATNPIAINDSGEVVGTWTDSAGIYHGFYWTEAAGFTSFDPPKATRTLPSAINASGVIAGSFTIDSLYQVSRGFMLDTTNGVFTIIKVPGSTTTNANGINSQGTIVGSYEVGKLPGGSFLYQP